MAKSQSFSSRRSNIEDLFCMIFGMFVCQLTLRWAFYQVLVQYWLVCKLASHRVSVLAICTTHSSDVPSCFQPWHISYSVQFIGMWLVTIAATWWTGSSVPFNSCLQEVTTLGPLQKWSTNSSFTITSHQVPPPDTPRTQCAVKFCNIVSDFPPRVLIPVMVLQTWQNSYLLVWVFVWSMCTMLDVSY